MANNVDRNDSRFSFERQIEDQSPLGLKRELITATLMLAGGLMAALSFLELIFIVISTVRGGGAEATDIGNLALAATVLVAGVYIAALGHFDEPRARRLTGKMLLWVAGALAVLVAIALAGGFSWGSDDSDSDSDSGGSDAGNGGLGFSGGITTPSETPASDKAMLQCIGCGNRMTSGGGFCVTCKSLRSRW